MNVLEAIQGRRATRSYLLKQVSEKSVHQLLDAAVQAPSARNLQPWSFVVIQDKTLLKAISEQAKNMLMRDSHWNRELPLADPEFDIFYGAGTLIVVCAKEEGFSPVGDCYMAGQNLMLAAHGLGLATCPIGLARDVLRSPEMQERLGVPAGEEPVLPIIVGYPAAATPRVARAAPRINAWLR